jgi:hypothetical protein
MFYDCCILMATILTLTSFNVSNITMNTHMGATHGKRLYWSMHIGNADCFFHILNLWIIFYWDPIP